jgi:signal transduction histidine kinase/ActR/RegA family two-component response regulator
MNDPKKKLKVLLIDDSSSDGEEISSTLAQIGIPFILERIATLDDFKKALSKENWDVVISEFSTKHLSAYDSLNYLQEFFPNIPLVLVTNGIGEEKVADMMKAGIEDYVSKSRLDRLNLVIKKITREKEVREKEAKARELAQKALAAKEQMLAIVSHDIKNPLSAINLQAQMLLRSAERSENKDINFLSDVRTQAKRILNTTEKLKNLIVDLLDRSKSENGLSILNKEKIKLNKLIKDVLDTSKPLFQQKEIDLNIDVPYGLDLIIDKNKIYQVLSNLISNAINYTPEKGKISLQVVDHENEVVFYVSDNGIGLKQEDLNNVFEKFWTGNTSGLNGTGLGLFICKTIVEAHKGFIWVENIPDGGACFTFTIPKENFGVTKSHYHERRANNQRAKVMIIDDDEDLIDVMSWALAQEGYLVQPFLNPIEGLQALKNFREIPDLILVDYHLDAMKGDEFLREKNAIPMEKITRCPVIMISASPTEIEQNVPKNLYREILTKPLDLDGLIEKIEKHFNQ